MYSRLEKKLLQIKKIKLNGVRYEIKRCTPADFLGKEGIPVSKWQTEAQYLANKETCGNVTWEETQESYRKIFNKSIVSINGLDDKVEGLIEVILDNYYISNKLYAEIISHALGTKKKTLIFR